MLHEKPGHGDCRADLVLRGGRVLALDEADTRAGAIAVRAGRIVAVGGEDELVGLIGPDTHVVDLDGRAVIPGINDSHLHATWLGAIWPDTVMGGMAPGQGDPERPGGGPGASPGAAGDPHDTSAAPRLLASERQRRDAILRAGALLASLGITSYTEPGIGPGEDDGATGCFGRAVLDTYRALDEEGALTARVTVLALFGELDGPSSLADFEGGLRRLDARTPRPEWLRVAGVKIFGDGIPPMLQAWTRHEYPGGGHGGLLVAGADLREKAANLSAMVRLAHRLGYQVGVHATGDLTIDAVIDAVEAAVAADGAELRHYVIHGDLVTPRALSRMAELGMGLTMQSGIAAATSPWVEGILGAQATAAAWPIEAALRTGVRLTLSSDAPILAPDWRHGIADADAWMGTAGDRHERMRALLRAYTTAPAWQDGAEGWKGTLEPGKVADLCVLAADPYELAPSELPEVDVDLTIVDGRVVYAREPALR